MSVRRHTAQRWEMHTSEGHQQSFPLEPRGTVQIAHQRMQRHTKARRKGDILHYRQPTGVTSSMAVAGFPWSRPEFSTRFAYNHY